MKKLFAVLSITLFTLASSLAQQTISEQYIPDVVKNKVHEMFPEAKGIYYKQPMAGFIDAYFTVNKRKCNATFLVGGAWVSTDTEIPIEEFPDSANQYLVAHTDKIMKYYRSESKAKGLQFSADAKINGDVMQFIFDEHGNYLMKGPRD